jgi:hypothetical protein
MAFAKRVPGIRDSGNHRKLSNMPAQSKRTPPKVGRLPSRTRMAIYGVGGGVWLTGCLWLIFHYYVKSNDEFGFENNSPYEIIWLASHAGLSFAAIWIFGFLWVNHIKIGWVRKVHRLSGGILFGFTFLLILTGYLLYYVGNSNVRSWISLVHWVLGLVALFAFLSHRLSWFSFFSGKIRRG